MRIVLATTLIALSAAPALAQDLVFTLVNDSSQAIVELYVSPADEELWGENILTVDSVPPGTSGEVTIADGLDVCEYDIGMVSDEGEELTDTQDLCTLTEFTVTD